MPSSRSARWSWSSSSVIVENNATHIGYYPIVFGAQHDRIEVESGPSPGDALQTGDRVDLQALTAAQRFSLLRGAPARSQMTCTRRPTDAPFRPRSPRARSTIRRAPTITRDVGVPLCFFLSLALASALFLMRPRPITLAFYLYTMLMLVKVNQTALDLANWPISLTAISRFKWSIRWRS